MAKAKGSLSLYPFLHSTPVFHLGRCLGNKCAEVKATQMQISLSFGFVLCFFLIPNMTP